MADANRKTVEYLVLHHAVTPLWPEKTKAQLAQWFSDNGFARAYGSNANNWSGLINPYTGGRSYSQAHYAGQQVNDTTPDATAAEKAAGFRLVQLVDDIWGQITWHAGNWPVNCAAIGIEILGDYRNYTLRDGDCRVIADFWRPHDQELGGATSVVGHREVSQTSTECPARIMENRDAIVNYINNPPTPPAPTTPTWVGMEKPRTMRLAHAANLINVATGAFIKAYEQGQTFDFVQKTDWNGKTYLRTQYSTDKSLDNGFYIVDLAEMPVITIKNETKTEEIAYQSETQYDTTLDQNTQTVQQAGKNGVRTITYEVIYTDGKETERKEIGNEITTAPITEVIIKGTATPPVTPPADDNVNPNFWNELLKKIVESLTQLLNWMTKKGGKK